MTTLPLPATSFSERVIAQGQKAHYQWALSLAPVEREVEGEEFSLSQDLYREDDALLGEECYDYYFSLTLTPTEEEAELPRVIFTLRMEGGVAQALPHTVAGMAEAVEELFSLVPQDVPLEAWDEVDHSYEVWEAELTLLWQDYSFLEGEELSPLMRLVFLIIFAEGSADLSSQGRWRMLQGPLPQPSPEVFSHLLLQEGRPAPGRACLGWLGGFLNLPPKVAEAAVYASPTVKLPPALFLLFLFGGEEQRDACANLLEAPTYLTIPGREEAEELLKWWLTVPLGPSDEAKAIISSYPLKWRVELPHLFYFLREYRATEEQVQMVVQDEYAWTMRVVFLRLFLPQDALLSIQAQLPRGEMVLGEELTAYFDYRYGNFSYGDYPLAMAYPFALAQSRLTAPRLYELIFTWDLTWSSSVTKEELFWLVLHAPLARSTPMNWWLPLLQEDFNLKEEP